MKDYIQENYPEKLSYDRLRTAVQEVWEYITPDTLKDLMDSMPERCQAVLDANGKHTEY